MTNDKEGGRGDSRDGDRVFDLEERTAQFGEAVIHFVRTVPVDPVTRPLITQPVRSSTSVGANYCEADNASSKKDFRHRIRIVQREARETKHWMRMLSAAHPPSSERAGTIWREAHELHLIFSAILRRLRPD